MVLARLGFRQRSRNWVCMMLSTATTTMSINGSCGEPIRLACGLRHGVPPSPLLSMDKLQAMVAWATGRGHLTSLGIAQPVPRISLYADDAALFFKPTQHDCTTMPQLLKLCGEALGLKTNLQVLLFCMSSARISRIQWHWLKQAQG